MRVWRKGVMFAGVLALAVATASVAATLTAGGVEARTSDRGDGTVDVSGPLVDPTVGELLVEARVALLAKISILMDLDAFDQPTGPVLNYIGRNLTFVEGDRATLVAALRDVDGFGELLMGDFWTRGLETDGNLDVVMLRLLPEEYSDLLVGTIYLDPLTYERALADLFLTDTGRFDGPINRPRLIGVIGDHIEAFDLRGAALSERLDAPGSDFLRRLDGVVPPPGDPSVPAALEPPTTTVASSTTSTSTTLAVTTTALAAPAPRPAASGTERTPAPEPGTKENGGFPLAALGVGGLVVLTLAALMLLARRRQRIPGPAGPHGSGVRRLLGLGRHLAGARDIATVERVAVEQTLALVDADVCAVVHRGEGGLTLGTVSSEDLLETSGLVGGSLVSVVESGVALNMVSDSEPFLVFTPSAVMAHPLISDGQVKGVLVAVRSGDRAFTAAEVSTLGAIAPMVATAATAAEDYGTMVELAMIDPLTSLANRRKLEADLAQVERRRNSDGPVAFAMVDVDHFKSFNDTFGHAAGDEVLRRVAEVISGMVRDSDVVYRYGGEEFSILLPGAGVEEARIVAERVRVAVEALDVPGGRVTVSVGVADADDPRGLEDLTERADGALYAAKQAGRNRVHLAGPAGPVV